MKTHRQDNELSAPTHIPHVEGLESLYGQEEVAKQTARYAALVQVFKERAYKEHAHSGSTGMDFTSVPSLDKTSRLRFYSSPGRTELCGNHTDHNRGNVLAAAIQMDMAAVACPSTDSLVQVRSEGFGEFTIDIADNTIHPEEQGSSQALVRGIADGIRRFCKQRKSAKDVPLQMHGFSACIQSNVLPGSGLSSSASFEVLIGSILADCNQLDFSPSELAQIGQYAENHYFGKPCGLMDQMACALGQIAALDFVDPENPNIRLFSFDPEDYGYSLLIVNTGGSHADLTDSYRDIPLEMISVARIFGKEVLRGVSLEDLKAKIDEIRKTCGDRAFVRAYHFITENERAQKITEAITKGDIAEYLEIVHRSSESSWKYLQNLYPNESPRDEGLAVALAMTEEFFDRKTAGKGVCRVHGGGFAGTIQVYIPYEYRQFYIEEMEKLFGKGSVFPLRIRPYGVVCIDRVD